MYGMKSDNKLIKKQVILKENKYNNNKTAVY